MSVKILIPNYLNNPYNSSLFYPSYMYPTKILPRSTFRSLGTAALDSTPVSISYNSPINSVLSDNIHFSYPLTPIGPMIDSNYDTVDDDIELRSKMTKYFYERFFNRWILDEYSKLLKFYKVKQNKITKITSKKDYENNILNNEQKRVIVNYIINNVYDKYDLKSSIKTFIRKSRTKWFELKDNKDDVKHMIYRDLKKKIKDTY